MNTDERKSRPFEQARSAEPPAGEPPAAEEPLPSDEPWPADEAPTDEAGEWVKPCGCPGGWNEHHLDCPEVQNYL